MLFIDGDLASLENMTLTGAGVYIFRVPSSLTANVGSTVDVVRREPVLGVLAGRLRGHAQRQHLRGNVVAQAGVTLGVGASLTGRALATNVR
jgi:hypothetical protein